MNSSSAGNPTPLSLDLPESQVAALFPFHILFDHDLRILQTGPSLRHVCPGALAGANIADLFELERPRRELNYPGLIALSGQLVLWKFRENAAHLRGQIVATRKAHQLAFLCSPWLPKPGMLRDIGLHLDDFAVHDTTPEFVQVLRSQHLAIEDLRRLATKLDAQKRELSGALKTLRETDQQVKLLSSIASLTENGVIVTNRQGRIEWVNASFTRLTGYELDEVRGEKPGAVLQGKRSEPTVLEYMRAKIAAGESFHCRLANYTRAGRMFWADMEVQPISDNSGAITNFIGIQTDVTERVDAEDRASLAYAVTRILAERDDSEIAVDEILETICSRIGAAYGGLWCREDYRGSIRLTNSWFDRPLLPSPFAAACRNTLLSPGDGLPGRVWHRNTLLTMPVLADASPFSRQAVALDAGFANCFAFPIRSAGKVEAVMEFFSYQEELPSPAILATLEALGTQIGQYVERRRAEAERDRALSMIQSSLESAPEGVLITDATGAASAFNQRWLELLQLHPDFDRGAWSGLFFALLDDPAPQIAAWRNLELATSGHRRQLCRLLDGRTLEIVSGPHIHNDVSVGRIWAFRDISNIVAAEKERERLLGILNTTLEATRDGILVTSLTRKVVTFNQRFLDLWRIPRPAAEAHGSSSMLPLVMDQPLDPQAFQSRVHWLYDHPDASAHEVIHFRDGRVYELNTHPQRVGDAIIGRVWSYTDVTARWLADVALRESEERYRLLVETAADAIVSFDELGNIRFANSAACRIFGTSPLEYAGQPVSLFFPDRKRRNYMRALARLLDGRASLPDASLELTARNSSGAEFPIELSLGISAPSPNRVFIAIMRDISQRKAIDLQLRLATRAAETANRAKSDFLANISHEIRTPLNAIVGLTEMLRPSVTSRDLRESVDSIWVSAESLLALINDLLDVSRIEAGHISIDSQEFDPAELGESAIGVLRTRADAKFLQLYFSIQPPAPPITQGDPNRIRQILVNLVSNAIKFTESGYVHLELNWQSDASGHVNLAYSVHDSGIGIPEASRKDIFESFYRVNDPVVSKAGGVGLGLPISRSLAERMGGTLSVESEPGHGSCFTLSIPRLPTARPSPRPATTGRRVILCSLPSRLRLQSRVFAAAGAEVLTADSPAAAMQLLAESTGLAVLAIDHDWATGQPGFTPPSSTPALSIFMTQAVKSSDAWSITSPLTPARVTDALRRPALDQLARSAPTTPAAAPQQPGTGRLLLVEDNPAGQLYMRQLFTRAGFSVSVAASGAEALHAFNSCATPDSRPELILMDVLLPDASGIEIIRAIRAAESSSDQPGPIPIITLTAHALANYRADAFAAGADDYVTKPARPGELLDAVRRWLKSPFTVLILAGNSADADALAERLPASLGYQVTCRLPGDPLPDRLDAIDAVILHAVAPTAAYETALSLIRPRARRIVFGAKWTAHQIALAAAGAPISLPDDDVEFRRIIRRLPPPATEPTSAVAVDNQVNSEIAALAGAYLQSTNAAINQAVAAMTSGDFIEVARFAHGIKGTAAAYGFPILSELAARLEDAARQPNPLEITHDLREMHEYVGKLLELRIPLNAGPNP